MTNRELAIAIWILIAAIIILVMTVKNVKLRNSLLNLFIALGKLFKNFIMQFLFVYTLSILVLFIYSIHRWDFEFSMIFTFLIFTIMTYIPIIWNTTLSDEVVFQYREYFKQIFSVTVLVALLVTTYTFSFVVEFVLIVPSLIFLGMLKAYIDYHKKYEDIQSIVNKLISIIGFIILINWGIQLARNFFDLLTLEFWLSFTVDFWGIIAYIPAILVLPYFLSVDRKVRWYESYNHLDYIKLPFYYLLLGIKYKLKKKITTFDIYEIEVLSKPYSVFSVYAEIDKDVDVKKLYHDIQTYCLKLRSGDFDEYGMMENTNSIRNQDVNLYADVIYFYFSIKGEKKYYPWHKLCLWRNPRLYHKYLPVDSSWINVDDDLFEKPLAMRK